VSSSVPRAKALKAPAVSAPSKGRLINSIIFWLTFLNTEELENIKSKLERKHERFK